MRVVYHIVAAEAEWRPVVEKTNDYRAASLLTEGFIHCSNKDQLGRVANLFYANCAELWVLGIRVESLTSEVRDEDPGTGELFPHVYGPINREAVIGVEALRRGPDGKWLDPEK